VAQGTIIAGGVTAEGQGARVTQGVPTAGVIPSGATIEREVDFNFAGLTQVRLALRTPDFTTAGRIEQAINSSFGRHVALMLDAGTVQVDIAATQQRSPAHAMGVIENILVEPERRARVVVDQRSGTIVMGEDVRISRVAGSPPYRLPMCFSPRFPASAICFCRSRKRSLSASLVSSTHWWHDMPSSYVGRSRSSGRIGRRQA